MSWAELCPLIGVGCVLLKFCPCPCPQKSYFCPILASGCRFCPCPHFLHVLSSIFAFALALGTDFFAPSFMVLFLPLPQFLHLLPSMFAFALALSFAISCHGNMGGKGTGKHLWQNMGEMGARAKTRAKPWTTRMPTPTFDNRAYPAKIKSTMCRRQRAYKSRSRTGRWNSLGQMKQVNVGSKNTVMLDLKIRSERGRMSGKADNIWR